MPEAIKQAFCRIVTFPLYLAPLREKVDTKRCTAKIPPTGIWSDTRLKAGNKKARLYKSLLYFLPMDFVFITKFCI
jgi:hypothetical protein